MRKVEAARLLAGQQKVPRALEWRWRAMKLSDHDCQMECVIPRVANARKMSRLVVPCIGGGPRILRLRALECGAPAEEAGPVSHSRRGPG